MKKLIIAVLAAPLLLTSCARPPAPPAPAASTNAEAAAAGLAAFSATRAHEESYLRSATTALVRAGRSLPPAAAESCWREELARPMVRDLCLLLWAGGAEDSPALSAALLERSSQSTVAAAALARRLPRLHGLSSDQLRTVLSQLKEAPLWLRARLALRWMEEHPSVDRLVAESIADEIGPHPTASPLDLAMGFRATWKASRTRFATHIKSYCHPAAAGDARLRCWRLLGALADPDQDPALSAQLRGRLPAVRDSSWQLFTRAYPALALRIQKNLEEK